MFCSIFQAMRSTTMKTEKGLEQRSVVGNQLGIVLGISFLYSSEKYGLRRHSFRKNKRQIITWVKY